MFGVELMALASFPAASAARLVRLGTVLERVEWILVVLWLGSMCVKLGLLLLGARLGLSSLFPGIHPAWLLLFVVTAVFIWQLFILPTLAHVLEIFVFRLRLRAWPHLAAELTPLLRSEERRVGNEGYV